MIDCTFYVEAQGNNKTAVENSLQNLLTEVEKRTHVVSSTFDDIAEHTIEGTQYYSGILQIHVETDFRTFVILCMRVTPTAIEVETGEVSLTQKELLPVFGDISSHITRLSKKLGIAIQQTGGSAQDAPGLDPDFIDEVLNYGGVLMKMVFEGRSDSEENLKKAVMESVNASSAYVNKMNAQRTEGPDWTGVVGAELLFEDIEDVFLAVVKLTPVAMSIEEPDDITLSIREIQNIGMDLSEVVNSFVSQSIASHL